MKKGQQMLIGIIIFFVILIVFVALFPAVNESITIGINSSNSEYSLLGPLTTIINYLPLILIITLIIALFVLTVPR